jgi:hypothetical protein
MDRISGFYRVKIKGKPDIAYWDSKDKYWYLAGEDMWYDESDFEEIDETPIPLTNEPTE